jgi:hypothetical protein
LLARRGDRDSPFPQQLEVLPQRREDDRARTTSAPAVPVAVSGSSAVAVSASFIFIGTSGSSRACSPSWMLSLMIRRATGSSIMAAA